MTLTSFFLIFFIPFLISCKKPSNLEKYSNTIVIWEQEDAQATPYIDSVFSAFKNLPENKGVQIIRTHYQTEDLRQQFQAASLAGVPPDILMGPSDTAGVYAVSGFIMPVDEYFDLSKYNEAVVQAITLDGKTFGIPISNGNHLMLFYNKKFVKKPPQTTNELFSYCNTEIKKYKLDYCIAFDMGEPFWLMPWLGAFGGWPLNNKTPTLNTQAMRNAINFYIDLKFNKKYVPMECDYNCMDSLFKESKVAFIINGDWALSTYESYFKKDFGIAVIPKLSETGLYPTPMISGKYFMLSSGVKPEKINLIVRLIDFYTNKENQIKQYKMLKRLPALKDAANSQEIISDEISRTSIQQISKGKPMPMAIEMRAIWDSTRNYLGLATTKKISVDEAVEKLQKDVEKKIEQMNR